MISAFSKKVIACAASAILLFCVVYGSYLPLRKSRMYISALQNAAGAHSLQEYMADISVPLDAASPVGQEELVRNSASGVLGIINASGAKNPAIIPPLLDFINARYEPIIARGRGMSFEQNLYVLGAINESAFTFLNDSKYLATAQQYFEQGLAASPTRPQFIYGLFDVYRIEGNYDRAKAMYDLIETYWPSDPRTKPAFDDFTKKYEVFIKQQKAK